MAWFFIASVNLGMHHPSDTPSGLRNLGQQCVEIRLWEVYFIRCRNNLKNILSAYALEGRPLENSLDEQERLTYRFFMPDWECTIRGLLTNNSIPFEILRTFNTHFFGNRAKKKIYVAEEELDTLFSINSTLEYAGYDVFLSHSAKPLMEDVLPPIDLFILDKSFSDGDGLKIYNHLRSRNESTRTPIIILSSVPLPLDVMTVGVHDILKKPFAMEELLMMVNRYTSTDHAHQYDSLTLH